MNTSYARRRVPAHLAVVAAVLTGSVGAIAGATIAGGADGAMTHAIEVDDSEATPIWVQVRERQQLLAIVERMPAGWPATEVMRREAAAPLGTAADRVQWRRIADEMPTGWPATEVMRRAAQEPAG